MELDVTQIRRILTEDNTTSDDGVWHTTCRLCSCWDITGEPDLDVCTEADEDDPDVDLYELLYGLEREHMPMGGEREKQHEKLREGEC